jgi:hypothetical protein
MTAATFPGCGLAGASPTMAGREGAMAPKRMLGLGLAMAALLA